jgi:hypothetical protein
LIQKNLHLGATLAVFDAAKTENAALLAAQTLPCTLLHFRDLECLTPE